MMNNARLSVGLQGVAIAERAYQHASAYAAERVQGKSLKTGERVTINQHKDVQRMLMTMKSQIEAGRALAYDAALALDHANTGDKAAQAKVDIMTPIVKSWCTDMAVEVTSLGVQIHGGCGFVEETGAAQYYRDARILPIYEGTNGIQALDLIFRKTLRDGGAGVKAYIATLRDDELQNEFNALEGATDQLLKAGADKDLDLAQAMAAPYLKAFGIIAGAAMLKKSARTPSGSDTFDQEKQKTEAFFAANILPLATGYLAAATHGAKHV